MSKKLPVEKKPLVRKLCPLCEGKHILKTISGKGYGCPYCEMEGFCMNDKSFSREIYRDVISQYVIRGRELTMLRLLRDSTRPILSTDIARSCGITTKRLDSMGRAVRKMAEILRNNGHPILANDDGYWLSNNGREILEYCRKRRAEIEIMYQNALATVERLESIQFVKDADEKQMSLL